MVSDEQTEERLRKARRDFMKTCGKFAVVTPTAMVLLMSGSGQTYAAVGSHNGFHGRPPRGNNGTVANANFDEAPRSCGDERLRGNPDVFQQRRLCPSNARQPQQVRHSIRKKRDDLASAPLPVKNQSP